MTTTSYVPQFYTDEKTEEKDEIRRLQQESYFDLGKQGFLQADPKTDLSNRRAIPYLHKDWPTNHLTGDLKIELDEEDVDLLDVLTKILDDEDCQKCMIQEYQFQQQYLNNTAELNEQHPLLEQYYSDLYVSYRTHSLLSFLEAVLRGDEYYGMIHSSTTTDAYLQFVYKQFADKEFDKIFTTRMKTNEQFTEYVSKLQELDTLYGKFQNLLADSVAPTVDMNWPGHNFTSKIFTQQSTFFKKTKNIIKNPIIANYLKNRRSFYPISAARVAAKKQANQAQQISRLADTRTITHANLQKAINQLHANVYHNNPHTTPSIDDKTIASALALLQLACGSRFIGVILGNYIDPTDYMLLNEQNRLVREGIDTDSIKLAYANSRQCITVYQLTKEKDSIRQIINRNKAKGRSTNFDEKEDAEQLGDLYTKTAVRPLHYDYFIPNRKNQYDVTAGIKNFLHLLRAVRKYVKTKCKIENKYWKLHKIDAFNDVQGHIYIPTKTMQEDPEYFKLRIQPIYQKTNNLVKQVLKIDSDGPSVNEGTHDLRRIYAASAYRAFGSKTTTEVEFVRSVFSHASYETSLRYTTIKIDPNTVDFTPKNLLKAIEEVKKLKTELTKLIKRERQEPFMIDIDEEQEINREVITFPHKNGRDTVNIRKLGRAQRNSSTDDKIFRGITKGEELIEKGVLIAKARLLQLRINTEIVHDVYGYLYASYAGENGENAREYFKIKRRRQQQ